MRLWVCGKSEDGSELTSNCGCLIHSKISQTRLWRYAAFGTSRTKVPNIGIINLAGQIDILYMYALWQAVTLLSRTSIAVNESWHTTAI